MAESMDFLEKFIKAHPVSQDALDHFAAASWTKAYLENPDYESIPTYSRTLKPSREDYFFAKTVKTSETIPHMISLRLKDLNLIEETPRTNTSASDKERSHKAATQVPDKPDCLFLFHLAKPGLDGHPGVLHGGMACAILDEMMGICIMLHHQKMQTGTREQVFTVNLNTTYRTPVLTGEDVLVRCWMITRQGRKMTAAGQIVDKTGKVLSEAIGTWVIAKLQGKL